MTNLSRKDRVSILISSIALGLSVAAFGLSFSDFYFRWFWEPHDLRFGAAVNVSANTMNMVLANRGKRHETILGIQYWVRERDGAIDKARPRAEGESSVVCEGTDSPLSDEIFDPDLHEFKPEQSVVRDEKGNVVGTRMHINIRAGAKGYITGTDPDGKKRKWQPRGFVEKNSQLAFYTFGIPSSPFTIKPDDVLIREVDFPEITDEHMSWPMVAIFTLIFSGKSPAEVLAQVSCYELWVGLQVLRENGRTIEKLQQLATFTRNPKTKKFEMVKVRDELRLNSAY